MGFLYYVSITITNAAVILRRAGGALPPQVPHVAVTVDTLRCFSAPYSDAMLRTLDDLGNAMRRLPASNCATVGGSAHPATLRRCIHNRTFTCTETIDGELHIAVSAVCNSRHFICGNMATVCGGFRRNETCRCTPSPHVYGTSQGYQTALLANRNNSPGLDIAVVAVRHSEAYGAFAWLVQLHCRYKFLMNNGATLPENQTQGLIVLTVPNVCRESYAYLQFATQYAATCDADVFVFTQVDVYWSSIIHAKKTLAVGQTPAVVFSEWIRQLSQEGHAAQACASYYHLLTASDAGPDPTWPFAFNSVYGPAGPRLLNGYHVESVCPGEDWRTFAAYARYSTGATVAVSRSLLMALPQASLHAIMDELNASRATFIAKKGERPRSSCLKEYAMERSWLRLFANCSKHTAPAPCVTARYTKPLPQSLPSTRGRRRHGQ